MEVVRGLENIKGKHRNAVVVLGFFDGFHRGHQALVHQAKTLASPPHAAAPVLVYTFDRHPLEVVNPKKAPLLLSTLEEKIKLAQEFPIDFLLIGKFDPPLSRLEPSDFIKNIVADTLRPKGIVVGYNYRYGKEHQGDAQSLAGEAANLNLSVTIVQPVMVNGTAVSSSQIRELLGNGRVEEAGHFLGRPYDVEGKVVAGKGRGKTFGFPTANLEVSEKKLIPKAGIYAGYIHLEGARHSGLISIGNAPTFGPGEPAIEAYLFDFQGDLYGRKLRLEFLAWRREQKKFPSAEALIQAMQEDRAWGQNFFECLKEHFPS